MGFVRDFCLRHEFKVRKAQSIMKVMLYLPAHAKSQLDDRALSFLSNIANKFDRVGICDPESKGGCTTGRQICNAPVALGIDGQRIRASAYRTEELGSQLSLEVALSTV